MTEQQIKKRMRELAKTEKETRRQRATYIKSNVYIYGDALHQKLNRQIDICICEQNKLSKILDILEN